MPGGWAVRLWNWMGVIEVSARKMEVLFLTICQRGKNPPEPHRKD